MRDSTVARKRCPGIRSVYFRDADVYTVYTLVSNLTSGSPRRGCRWSTISQDKDRRHLHLVEAPPKFSSLEVDPAIVLH